MFQLVSISAPKLFRIIEFVVTVGSDFGEIPTEKFSPFQ